jgi:hypothetical protein
MISINIAGALHLTHHAERSANWRAAQNIGQFAIVRIKLNCGSKMVFAACQKGFTFPKGETFKCCLCQD